MIHLLNDKQTELLTNFMCCFIKPDKLNEITPGRLAQLQLDNKTNYLPDHAVFLVKHIQRNLPKTMAQEVIGTLIKASVKCAACLQRENDSKQRAFNHFASVDVYTRKTFPNCKTEDVYTRFAALF